MKKFIAITFIFSLITINGCKKEIIPHGILPPGTKVWVRWQNWNGGNVDKNGNDSYGYDMKDYWIIDSIDYKELDITSITGYFCHNEKGQTIGPPPDMRAITGVPVGSPDYHPVIWLENEIQLNPCSMPWIDKVLH